MDQEKLTSLKLIRLLLQEVHVKVNHRISKGYSKAQCRIVFSSLSARAICAAISSFSEHDSSARALLLRIPVFFDFVAYVENVEGCSGQNAE